MTTLNIDVVCPTILKQLLELYKFEYEGEQAIALKIHTKLRKEYTDCFITSPGLVKAMYAVGATAPVFWNRSAKVLRQNYRLPSGINSVYTARLLADCKRGESVTYCDGNPQNLMPSNLKITASEAQGPTPLEIVHTYNRQPTVADNRDRLLGYLVNPAVLDRDDPFTVPTDRLRLN